MGMSEVLSVLKSNDGWLSRQDFVGCVSCNVNTLRVGLNKLRVRKEVYFKVKCPHNKFIYHYKK